MRHNGFLARHVFICHPVYPTVRRVAMANSIFAADKDLRLRPKMAIFIGGSPLPNPRLRSANAASQRKTLRGGAVLVREAMRNP